MFLPRLAALLAAGVLAIVPTLGYAAQKYPAIYVFGDSLSDAGNDWIFTQVFPPAEPAPPYYNGHFSNGLTWVEDLAAALKLGPLKPSLNAGTDFAFGGAESGPSMVHAVSELPPDLPYQIEDFQFQVPHPVKGALYVLWIGSNDLFDILGHTPALTKRQVAKTISEIVANETGAIRALHASGARNLLVLTVPDLGHVPGVEAQGPAAADAASALAAAFDAALASALQAQAARLGISLTLVDAFTTMDMFIANPTDYGFTDIVDPCWTGTYAGTGGTLCSKLRAVQNQHLFWDQIHPTAAAHALIGGLVEAQLP